MGCDFHKLVVLSPVDGHAFRMSRHVVQRIQDAVTQVVSYPVLHAYASVCQKHSCSVAMLWPRLPEMAGILMQKNMHHNTRLSSYVCVFYWLYRSGPRWCAGCSTVAITGTPSRGYSRSWTCSWDLSV
jgi:hypothetical protein